jgi:hypothetical protein
MWSAIDSVVLLMRLATVPILISIGFSIVVYLPEQALDHLVAVAEIAGIAAAQSYPNWRLIYSPVVISLFVFNILLAAYCLAPMSRQDDRQNNSEPLSGLHYCFAALAIIVAITPSLALWYVVGVASDRVRLDAQNNIAATISTEMLKLRLYGLLLSCSLVYNYVSSWIIIKNPGLPEKVRHNRWRLLVLLPNLVCVFLIVTIVYFIAQFLIALAILVLLLILLVAQVRLLLGKFKVISRVWRRLARDTLYSLLPLLAAILLVRVFFTVNWRPELLSNIGPVALLLFVSCSLLAIGAWAIDAGRRNVFPAAACLVAIWLFVNVGFGDLVLRAPVARIVAPNTSADAAASAEDVTKKIVSNWIGSRLERSKKAGHESLTINVVTAQGGGIYAAYHASSVLSIINALDVDGLRTVFAVVGVSGGAVGAAIFDAVISGDRTSIPDGSLPPKRELPALCEHHKQAARIVDQRVKEFLSQDYLSPIVGSWVTNDLLNDFGIGALFRIVRGIASPELARESLPDRARVLRNAIIGRIRRIEAEPRQAGAELIASGAGERLLEPVSKRWMLNSNRPALFAAMTGSTTGGRLYTAPFSIEHRGTKSTEAARQERRWFSTHMAESGLSSIDAALLSARFPLISPPGMVVVEKRDNAAVRQPYRVVDGGYFDNSGASTATDILELLGTSLKAMDGYTSDEKVIRIGKIEVRLQLIALTRTGDNDFIKRPEIGSLADFVGPATAIERGRNTRGLEFLQEAYNSRVGSVPISVVEVPISDPQQHLALGWTMSNYARSIIDGSLLGAPALAAEIMPKKERLCPLDAQ